MEYYDYLFSKINSDNGNGFDYSFMPEYLFDFQKYLVKWLLRIGRSACFADCGLGKSIIELVWAQNIIEKTNGKVLLLTPLAVGQQMKLESEKFGIEAHKSRNGKLKGKINITNYEQLEHYNPNDFEAVICDECFSPDTKINIIREKKLHVVNIKDCKINDTILNCAGMDRIKLIKKRKIKYAIEIGFNGKKIISSPNHPYFTQRGWVSAKEIQENDFIISTGKTMRILRGEISNNIQRGCEEKILRDILFSEMENESTRSVSKSSLSRIKKKKGIEEKSMVQVRRSKGKKRNRETEKIKPHEESRNKKESICEIEGNKSQTFHSLGGWSWDDITTILNEGCFIREMDSGICYISGKITKGLPDKLQSRLSKFEEKNCNRGRWELSLFEKRKRQKEGQETGYFGVESFEVLELGHNRLDKYRDEKGSLYFYDLEIERHPSFTVNDCLVHNSSILKNFNGKIKHAINIFMRKIPYRLLATATAAPNDFIELGTSSEALGYLGYMDMLNRFFKNDLNNSGMRYRGETIKWRLKGHAHQSFWRWITSWARAIRYPSDIGFSDENYILPDLIENDHELKINGRFVDGVLPGMVLPAVGLKEQRDERRATIKERCEKMVELAISNNDYSVLWCNLNDEGNLLEKIIPEAVQVSGRDSNDSKEEKLIAFSDGEIKKLITKPKIGAWGLNWQHCNHVLYFPTHSYEQKYQLVRRCWRFGQKRNVIVDAIFTQGNENMILNLKRKANQAKEMFDNLVQEMNNSLKINHIKNYNNKMEVPAWV